jgi:hypothetical protein
MPIAYCLLPIAYCLFPIAYCLLPIAYCLFPIALSQQQLFTPTYLDAYKCNPPNPSCRE